MKSNHWREHPATPRQQLVLFRNRNKRTNPTQARQDDTALKLPEIMQAGIAQHGARFNQIRSRGFVVESELSRDTDGRVPSRYWLHYDPERDGNQ